MSSNCSSAASSNSTDHSKLKLTYEMVSESVQFVREKIPSGFTPQIALVTGSGLGEIIRIVEIKARIPYNTIPNFPASTVKGHGGINLLIFYFFIINRLYILF